MWNRKKLILELGLFNSVFHSPLAPDKWVALRIYSKLFETLMPLILSSIYDDRL